MINYDPSRTALYSPELHETLFEGGKDYAPSQLAAECARLAYYRHENGAFEAIRLGVAVSLLGFGDPATFNCVGTHTQAFAAYRESDRTALLAIRGTQPDDLKDLAMDLRVAPVAWKETGGNAHEGFASAARELLPKISQFLGSNCKNRARLIVSGHSLGAAIAVLVSTVLRPTHLFTLGCPRVGDEEFARALEGIEGARYVNCCDLVTELPSGLAVYAHYRAMSYIDGEGALVEDADADFVRADRIRASTEYISKFALHEGNVKLRGFADHAPINYLRALWR